MSSSFQGLGGCCLGPPSLEPAFSSAGAGSFGLGSPQDREARLRLSKKRR